MSSRMTPRKQSLLDQGEVEGHAYGCVHLTPRYNWLTDVAPGLERDIVCGCEPERKICHNCKQEVTR